MRTEIITCDVCRKTIANDQIFRTTLTTDKTVDIHIEDCCEKCNKKLTQSFINWVRMCREAESAT